MAVYRISRYPRQLELRDGACVTVRPMRPDDEAALLEFFRRVPEEDRYFLKDDVTSPAVVHAWAEQLDYDRALPLLGFDGDRIVADAVLVRHRSGARSHAAEVRVLIDPVFRRWGLGVALMRELAEIAYDAELDQVAFELAEGAQDDAIQAARFLGAVEGGRVIDMYRGPDGKLHDGVFLTLPLGKWWEWSRY
jgi:GNAT superfamily N-acetyltransferase